jgi:glycosyltransferase involved in cell wall biosynthesis
MRVAIVDPPAYTSPFDRSLCAALARAGAEVELLTSPFAHDSLPPAEGYRVREMFYRRSGDLAGRPWARRGLRLAEHLPDMLRFRRGGVRDADIVHYQWLTLPGLDAYLLPTGHPRLLTTHGWLRLEAWRGRAPRGVQRIFDRMDALVALSEFGAARLREAGMPDERIHVIPHGALDYLTRLPDEAPLPEQLQRVEGPVVLCFGLIRPYKGVEILLEAFREVEGAELWVVGRPFGVSERSLRELAARVPAPVRLVLRYVPEREVAAYFRRADLVVLPHRDVEQSGVLYTALAFGKPIVMSDVGGFPEVAASGAGRLVPAGDPRALAGSIRELVADPSERGPLAAAARAAAAGPYSWERVAQQTVGLYRELLSG